MSAENVSLSPIEVYRWLVEHRVMEADAALEADAIDATHRFDVDRGLGQIHALVWKLVNETEPADHKRIARELHDLARHLEADA